MIEKRDRRNLILILFAIVGAVCVLRACGVLGVRPLRVSTDAQKNLKIEQSWWSREDSNARLSAGVFYDYDNAPLHGTWYYYVNRPGFSFGYFFRKSGKLTRDEGICRVDCGSYGTAYVSLNARQVAKIVRDDGTKPKTQKISPYHPFVVVSQKHDCAFRFYDEKGREVPVSGTKMVVQD